MRHIPPAGSYPAAPGMINVWGCDLEQVQRSDDFTMYDRYSWLINILKPARLVRRKHDAPAATRHAMIERVMEPWKT